MLARTMKCQLNRSVPQNPDPAAMECVDLSPLYPQADLSAYDRGGRTLLFGMRRLVAAFSRRLVAVTHTTLLALAFCAPRASSAPVPAAAQFHTTIQPILEKYCSDCHTDGMNKGGVAFDEFKSDDALVAKHD